MSFFLKGKIACWIVPEYRLLEIRLIGFWTGADMEIIVPELRRQVDEASRGGKDKFKVIVDATAFEIQIEPVREALVSQYMVYAISRGLEKSARVVNKAASEMQSRSMGKQANSASPGSTAEFGEFYTRGEALKWLGLPFFLPQDFTKDL